jgi:multimeric flavodoxin WrbA
MLIEHHMTPEKTLLIVYHSQSGNTEALSEAVEHGARLVPEVKTRRIRAVATNAKDLKTCKALVICSPEYFGYMAGAIKDLFDRTYEHVRDHVSGKSYAVVISAGNDGTGALSSIVRIAAGYRFKQVQEPIFCRGPVSESHIRECRRLGRTLAAGIDLGIY